MVQERFVTCAMCHMFPLLFLLQHHEAHEVDVFCLFIRCFCSNRMNIDPFRYSRGFLSWYDHATRCPRATRCPLIPSFCSNSSRWAFFEEKRCTLPKYPDRILDRYGTDSWEEWLHCQNKRRNFSPQAEWTITKTNT